MIVFHPESGGLLVEKLEVGDKFGHVTFRSNTNRPKSVRVYEVVKLLKWNVVCVSAGSLDLRPKRTDVLSHCYELNSPKLAELREAVKLEIRRTAATRFLDKATVKEYGDAELLTAIEAFEARMKAAGVV